MCFQLCLNFTLIGHFAFLKNFYCNTAYCMLRKPKIKFPMGLLDLRSNQQRSMNLVQSVLLETSQRLVKHETVNRLVLEVLPLLSKMIKPHLRPVNILLYTESVSRTSLKYSAIQNHGRKSSSRSSHMFFEDNLGKQKMKVIMLFRYTFCVCLTK